MRLECRERFPRHLLQRKPRLSDPSMDYGTCVTLVPWCMSGSLTRGGGEYVPDIPGALANTQFYVSGKRLMQTKRMLILATQALFCSILFNAPWWFSFSFHVNRAHCSVDVWQLTHLVIITIIDIWNATVFHKIASVSLNNVILLFTENQFNLVKICNCAISTLDIQNITYWDIWLRWQICT